MNESAPDEIEASPQSKVGVITVTHNSAGVLPDFLDSVARQTYTRFTLYVVDSGSSDSSVAVIEDDDRLSARVWVEASAENIGIAEGNNRGIARALQDGCDWILLLNNDTVFEGDLLDGLIGVAESRGIDLLSPLIEAAEPSGSIWYAGGHMNRWQSFRTVHERAGKPLSAAPTGLRSTGFGSACCLLVSRSVISATGLMNPLLFVYFDDVDFAIRARAAGFEFWYTDGVRMLHKASSLTGGAGSPFSIWWSSRNWPLLALVYTTGLTRYVSLMYVQTWTVARFMLGRDSLGVFRTRQRRFVDALRTTWVAAPAAALER